MFTLVEQWQAGTMSRKQFCENHNIALSTFAYWFGQYRRENEVQQESVGFVRIDPQGLVRVQGRSDVELIYPNGVRISISGSDLSGIAQLIHLW